MHNLIDIYVKMPAHNWRGYTWAYFESTRMSKTCAEAISRFVRATGANKDSLKAKWAK